MRQHLLNAYGEENARVLVTHAGVTQKWLDTIELDLNLIMLHDNESEWNMIGRARGGGHRCGGPVWCDYWAEFKPIPGIKQVFGHTQHRKVGEARGVVTQDGKNFNIDCLDTSNEVLVWSPELGFYPIDYRDL